MKTKPTTSKPPESGPNRCPGKGCQGRLFRDGPMIYSAASNQHEGPFSWQCVSCGGWIERGGQKNHMAKAFHIVGYAPMTFAPGEIRELRASERNEN